ncbi:unnamed protein product [Arctogadus glacialis]
MERDMQPAEEGPCAPKMCRQQQRGPCSSLKPFQSKRSAGKSRFDRSAMVEVPLFGGGGGAAEVGGGGGGQHPFSYNPGQPHPFTSSHHQQRVQQQPPHHQTTATISSTQQHQAAPPQQQHRFHCSENRPSSRAATSTSAAGSSAAGCPQRRSGGGERGAPRPDPGFSPGRAALVASPDCSYGISSENRMILDAFAQQCSRVLSLLNNGGRAGGPGPWTPPWGRAPRRPRRRAAPPPTPRERPQRSQWNQQQTSAFLRIFTDSLQNYLLSGPKPLKNKGLMGQPGGPEEEPCPAAEPGSGVSPQGHQALGGWSSPAPSESYLHPSSTLHRGGGGGGGGGGGELLSALPGVGAGGVLSLQQENEEAARIS